MVSLIAAVAQNGVIGAGNSLIWHISEDLKYFKSVTLGAPVVMGRKTFESLGRPLPGRTNVVVSRQKDFRPQGVAVAASLDEAMAMFDPAQEVFVIGGGEIYAQALPMADKMYLTVVHRDYGGDTRFPDWPAGEWKLVSEKRMERGEAFEYPFTFKTYVRIRK